MSDKRAYFSCFHDGFTRRNVFTIPTTSMWNNDQTVDALYEINEFLNISLYRKHFPADAVNCIVPRLASVLCETVWRRLAPHPSLHARRKTTAFLVLHPIQHKATLYLCSQRLDVKGQILPHSLLQCSQIYSFSLIPYASQPITLLTRRSFTMAPRASPTGSFTLPLAIANLLIPLSILIFATGFFPYKPFLPGLAEFEVLESGPPPQAPFDKLVFVVIDALRR